MLSILQEQIVSDTFYLDRLRTLPRHAPPWYCARLLDPPHPTISPEVDAVVQML